MTEERRLVTVMFADVVGSTALGEQLDAEDLRAMLADYYSTAKDVVTSYGGTLEKFIGDAVMGVFGLPHAYGDDAERALSASLELRDRVRADPNLSDLKLRFGVCSGEVVAGREPGADFLVTGDAVNVAARLQQAAEAWAVLASERTLAAVTGSFDVGPSLEVEAKGKGSAIAAREVRSRLAPARAVPRPRAPMRGRQDELEQLALVGRRAFRDKRPAFITIIAPAGTGKTRLLEEFLSRELASIAPSHLVAVAQCLPYGSQLTYWPLRQVLFRLVGVAEDAGSEQIRERVATWLQHDRYADLLATSIGYGIGEAPDRADVFAAWRYALEKASNIQPLALVFEDLHWSSESLLDLVDFVMQSHGDAPILMLALSRPELLDRRPGWGGGRRNFSNLFLEPLGDSDMHGLVRDLLEGGSTETIGAVVARAGGNPFYAEELVRSVAERGDIEALPDTVQASIQARLDLLPAEERHVLQVGSIFGRTFRISGVSALAAELVSRLDTLSEGLLRRDIVKREDEDHLSFVHILIREVAYQTLTRSDRARMHAAAGAWLESRAGGRESAVAELVALHYREAVSLRGRQRLADFDEPGVKAKAVLWLSRAGDAAGAAGAHLEAARHFRAAIEFALEAQLPELYERLGDVEQLRISSIDAYSKALELGRKSNWPAVDELRVLGGFLMCVMRWAEGVGRFPTSVVDRMLTEGHTLVDQVDDARSLAKFFAANAFYPWHVGRQGGEVKPEMVSRAEDFARRAAKLAEDSGDRNTWSAAIDGLASCAMERHDWAEARELAQRRIERLQDLGVLERMDAYHVDAWMSFLLGDLARMERTVDDSLGLLDYAQNPSLILALLGWRMEALTLSGRWDEAAEVGERVLHLWNETHEALGTGRIGFIVGLDISRARRDSTRANLFKEALLEMTPHVPGGSHLKAYADDNLEAIEDEVLAALRSRHGRIDLVERLLSRLSDRGYPVAESTLASVDRFADRARLPLLQAQVLRAKGDFTGAAKIWASRRAAPYEARARIELAQSQGQQPDAEMVAVLGRVGDVEYLDSHHLNA